MCYQKRTLHVLTTAQNFSQEVVQEFQVSTANFDASTGITEAGRVNIVTRSGGNQYHGTIFGYFRDNEYAGYPGLCRAVPRPNPTNDPVIAEFNEVQTNPEFSRRQFGGMFSGPLIRDKVFWLAALDNTTQRSVATFDPGFAEFDEFIRIKPRPLRDLMHNYRLDWRANQDHSFFWRFSRQRFFAQKGGTGFTDQEGNQFNRSYTVMMGWTAIFSPTFIGDFRAGFDRSHILQKPVLDSVETARLYAPGLPYMGQVNVSGTSMSFGARNNIPNESLAPRVEFVSNFTYNQGSNTWKFGFDIERQPWWLMWRYEYPLSVTVFNPPQARGANIPVPGVYDDLGDLFQLPIATFSFGMGKTPVLPGYAADKVRVRYRYQFYGGSIYRATPQLTLNWAINYSYEPYAVNWDLPKPASLRTILNGNVNPTRRDNNNIAPMVGFAWDPTGSGQTSIRGGFGIYYGTLGTNSLSRERGLIAPLGQSYVGVPGAFVTNPLTGQGTLAFPNAAANARAGIFRLADLVRFLPAIRTDLEQNIFTGNNEDLSVRNFDYLRGSSDPIIHPNFTMPYSLQYMLGVQRQFGADWFTSVSGVHNITNHVSGNWDMNRQFRPASHGGKLDPNLNQVQMQVSDGKSVYKGLAVSLRKRLSDRYQLGAAYTLSRASETNFSVNFDNRMDGFGPGAVDRTQLLNLSAVMQLPWDVQVAFVNSMESKAPFNPFLTQLDLNGDGTQNDRLPGICQNCVNRGASKDDLGQAVDDFNRTYSGQRDTLGTTIRTIALPGDFQTGDSTITQDIRVTKKFRFTERLSTDIMAEVFNLFNVANLTYPSSAGNLFSSGFGRPNARVDNVFGSAGPRSLQFALRINF